MLYRLLHDHGRRGLALLAALLLAGCDDAPTAPVRDEISRPRASASSVGAWADVSANYDHTCAIDQAGAVACWGYNRFGQASPPRGLGPATRIAAGWYHTCALTTAGAIACWGNDELRQVSGRPVDGGPFTQLTAGARHSCALAADGTVRCWGGGSDGAAVPPAGLREVVQVSGRGTHTCAVTASGGVSCWGADLYGEATPPPDLGPVAYVDVGEAHTCVLRRDGVVDCWGLNNGSQVGSPPSVTPPYAVRRTHPGPFAMLSAGPYSTCAVSTAGEISCWGMIATYAAPPTGLGPIAVLAVGYSHACALATTGRLTCWGSDSWGQANPPATRRVALLAVGGYGLCTADAEGAVSCRGSISAPPAGMGPVAQLTAGQSHACAIDGGGSLTCWGQSFAPPPSGLGPVLRAGAGHSHVCAVRTDGTVACWGRVDAMLDAGRLTPPADLGPVIDVAAGTLHSCALKADSTVACWASGYSAPSTPPPGLRGVRRVFAGTNRSCALLTDRTARCWPGEERPFGDAALSMIGLGTSHACALRTDGGVVCVGDNARGEARPPEGLSGVTQVGAGHEYSCALDGDGQLVCWGERATAAPPVAITGGPYAAAEGEGITFDGSASYDPAASVLTHAWSFAEAGAPAGDTARGARVTHAFPDDGTFAVELTVRNVAGLAGRALTTATIANAPPVATLSAPEFVDEGVPFAVRLVGATDPAPRDVAAGFRYAFDCGDGSGSVDAGPSVDRSCPAPDDAQRQVRGRVVDKDGGFAEYTAQVVVRNVPPSVNGIPDATILRGEPWAITGDFSDPGADAWTATVDYGDGTGVTPLAIGGRAFSLRHEYRAGGRFAATVTVRDDDAGTGSRSAVVTVLTPQEAIVVLTREVKALVASDRLPAGRATGLVMVLRHAARQLDAGRTTPAMQQMVTFTRMATALVRSGHLSAQEGAQLVAYATRIMRSIARS